MKRVCAFSLASCAALWLLTGVASAQGGDFDFGFAESPEQTAPDLVDPGLLEIDCIENDGPRWPAGSLADHTGLPDAVTQGTYFCTITQNDPCTGAVPIPNPDPPPSEILGPCTGGSTGAQGWQMSFSASGCNAVILGATATQTDIAPGDLASCEKGPGGEGGFDSTELTIGAGNEGAVHAIVLHLKKGTTLDPSLINFKPSNGPEENPATVCRFLVECTNPSVDGDMCNLTLAYVDGLQGSGQPIDNKVTQDGQSVVPTLNNEVIVKTGAIPRPPCDTVSDEYGLGFSADLLDSTTYYDPGIIGAIGTGGTHTVNTVEGIVPATTLYLNVTVGGAVPDAQQPQGWQLSFALNGDADLTEVSLGGAALYAVGDGPSTDGFDATGIIDPADNGGQEGFISGVVLHLKKGTTLADVAPDLGHTNVPGTVSAIRIELSGVNAQGPLTTSAVLVHQDGLIGGGQAIDNRLTVEGDSEIPCNMIPPETVDVTVDFVAGLPEAEFIRGDANDDGKNNLADAVWILNGAFRNPPHVPAACEDASDANNDGTVDPIVDAAFIIAYQFTLGPQPPAPFPLCGEDSPDVPVDIVSGLPDPLFLPPAPDDTLNCVAGSMAQCP